MLAASAFPIATGVVLALALFAGFTSLLIRDERSHPVRFRSTAIEVRSRTQLSHTRLATICLLFVLWSVWATARPVSGWR